MRNQHRSAEKRSSQGVLLSVILAAVLAACGSGADDAATSSTSATSSQFPVTVTADNGEVTVEARPTAIVSLSPTLTETLFSVGAGDQVVAVDSSSNYPEEAPTTDLSGFRPNVEAIGTYEPDLVFVARDRDGIVGTLEDVGITVLVLERAATLEDVYRQIQVVGDLTGNAEHAEQVVSDMRSSIEQMIGSVGSDVEGMTYFYELSSDYHSMTSDTFVGTVLSDLGLENIADGVDEEAGAYPQLNAEYLLDADPDLIFIAHTDGSVPTDEEIASRAGWSELGAVVEDRLVFLDPDTASRWGSRVEELVESITAALQGSSESG